MNPRKANTGPLLALGAAAAALTVTLVLASSDRAPPGVPLAPGAVATTASAAASAAKAYGTADYEKLERGRYVLETSGCHDCHTPGYIQNAGKVPEKDLLVGDRLGWQGPWGTTYPSNLRSVIGSMSEDQWVAYAKAMQPRPPMPWFNVRAMTERDLRAIHLYVKSLGPGGEPAPAYVPPGKAPAGPVVRFPG